MKYYPDVSDYDMTKTGGIALYLAHCDLDPLFGLIEQTDKALSDTYEQYCQLANEANNQGDFHTQSMYSDLEGVFVSKIVPLSYESLLLIIASRLEEAFKTWCRIIKAKDESLPSIHEFKCGSHGDLDKPIAYIQKFGHVEGIKADPLWENILAIWIARNGIIHHGGYIEPKQHEKLKRYQIGINPDDCRVYLESEVVKQLYKAVVDFVDRTFLLEPAGE